VQDINNLQAEKALGTQDQPNALTLNYIYELPFFKRSSNAFLHQTLGGWEVVGIYVARSGLPLTACIDHDVAGLTDGGQICQRPDVIAAPNLDSGQRSLLRYFNTDAFVLQAPGTFGNSARNNIRGPGLNNWDISLFKNFDLPHFLGHSGDTPPRLQFRGEFFNIFNHTQFSSINTDFVPAADVAGSPLSPSAPFGSVTGTRAPREIQLALKLIF
jgi:hypothetical protein